MKKRVRVQKLVKRLEKAIEWGELQVVIPHPLLSGKWQEESQGRNLLLSLTNDCLLEASWEGPEFSEVHLLTKGQANRIINQVRKNVADYTAALEGVKLVFDEWACNPPKEKAYGISTKEEEAQGSAEIREEEEKGKSLERQEEERSSLEETFSGVGESPYPNLDY